MNRDDAPLDARYAGGATATAFTHYAATGLLVAAALGIAVWATLSPPAWTSSNLPDAAPVLEAARAQADRTRIAIALDVHRVIDDTYPRSLEKLVDRGLLRPSDLYYANSSKIWVYQKHEDGYTLSVPTIAEKR